MGALQDLADEVGSLMSGFGLTTARSAWLKNTVDLDDRTFVLDGDTVSMGEGVAEIEDELVYVRQYDSASNSLVLSPDGRGYDGTSAASHAADTRIRLEPAFPKVAIKRAINRTILRTFPVIWGTGVVEFTYDSTRLTYELPAGTTKVLGVTYDTWGSTGAWLDINSYSFDGDADTTEYASGKSITLGSPGLPGRSVRVLVSKQPEALDESSSDFTETGLSASARYAVMLGTTAELLRYADPVRLASSSAQSDEWDSKQSVGLAIKLSNDFEAQFQNELLNEAKRLRQTYPARIVRKKF